MSKARGQVHKESFALAFKRCVSLSEENLFESQNHCDKRRIFTYLSQVFRDECPWLALFWTGRFHIKLLWSEDCRRGSRSACLRSMRSRQRR
eukprot:scaffold1321_cov154-Skeletonema_menzelii.AAC.6